MEKQFPLHQDISVCVVEDDDDLRESVVSALEILGFAVRGFPGSRELYLGLLREPCDVVVLDIGLPGEDGLSILKQLRATTEMGVIMLTARGQVADRVEGLKGGADAYLVKPADMEELAATVVSVARRLRPAEPVGNEDGSSWRLAADGWSLLSPAADRVALSAADRTLLEALFKEPGAVVPRANLVAALGFHPDEVLSNRLDMAISRLRRKVLDATGIALPLHAVRGVGFALAPARRK